jgi:hypothetical protein
MRFCDNRSGLDILEGHRLFAFFLFQWATQGTSSSGRVPKRLTHD